MRNARLCLVWTAEWSSRQSLTSTATPRWIINRCSFFRKLFFLKKVVEDCRDVAQEVPFIGTEEKCEELVFDECVEVRMFKLVLSFQSSKEH